MVINFFMPYSKPFLSVLALILIFVCLCFAFVFVFLKQKVLNVEMNFLPECVNILMFVNLHAV